MTNPVLNKQISNRNFLSPIGFKFTLAKNPRVAFFCNRARIPEITLRTESQSTYLKTIDVWRYRRIWRFFFKVFG